MIIYMYIYNTYIFSGPIKGVPNGFWASVILQEPIRHPLPKPISASMQYDSHTLK